MFVLTLSDFLSHALTQPHLIIIIIIKINNLNVKEEVTMCSHLPQLSLTYPPLTQPHFRMIIIINIYIYNLDVKEGTIFAWGCTIDGRLGLEHIQYSPSNGIGMTSHSNALEVLCSPPSLLNYALTAFSSTFIL